MADDENESETASRGADWEVVQLTASTYAAAPDPKGFVPEDDKGNEQDSASAMFMSRHFVFPPSEHENLVIEPEYSEIHSEHEVQDESPAEDDVGGGSNINEEEVSQSKSNVEQHGVLFFDNGRSLSVPDIGYEEDKASQVLNLIGEEESLYAANEPDDPSGQNVDSPKYRKPNEGDKYDGSGLPCEAWWKRHASSLYRHAKEANTFWSVFVAAALMGLVILGKRWQQEKWHQLKWQISDEKLSRMMGPIGRFKSVMVGGGHQRSPLIRDGASAGR